MGAYFTEDEIERLVRELSEAFPGFSSVQDWAQRVCKDDAAIAASLKGAIRRGIIGADNAIAARRSAPTETETTVKAAAINALLVQWTKATDAYRASHKCTGAGFTITWNTHHAHRMLTELSTTFERAQVRSMLLALVRHIEAQLKDLGVHKQPYEVLT